jgi:hypothetical protein
LAVVSQEKKASDRTCDRNDRLFRNSRPKESFLDECHQCH